MSGTTVCRIHGGKAPQVQQKARERILAAADPVTAELIRLALKGKTEAVRRQAADSVLDRAGLKAPDKQEITGAEGKPLSYRIVLVDPPKRAEDE